MTEGTEEPTEHKLEEARKKGDLPRSKDLGVALSMLMWWALVPSLGWVGIAWLAGFMGDIFSLAAPMVAHGEIDFFAHRFLTVVAIALAVPCAIGLVSTLVLEFMQTRGAIASKRELLDFQRINPASGMKQLFSMKRLLETAIALLRFAAIVAIALHLGTALLLVSRSLIDRPWSDPWAAAWLLGWKAFGWVGLVAACLGVADAFLQKQLWRKRNRMKKEEIRREHREQEGDPHVRATRRATHRDLASGG